MDRNDVKINANIDGLNDLMRSIKKAEKWRLRVGILGENATTEHDGKSNKTNAEIGTYHEFGTTRIPSRSFLFEPLSERISLTDWRKEAWKDYFVKFSPQYFYNYLAGIALNIVEGAFETGGYGKWKPLTARTLKRPRGTNKILMDTRSLRGSISTKVLKQ